MVQIVQSPAKTAPQTDVTFGTQTTKTLFDLYCAQNPDAPECRIYEA